MLNLSLLSKVTQTSYFVISLVKPLNIMDIDKVTRY